MKRLFGGLFKKQSTPPKDGKCTLYASYGLGVAYPVQGPFTLWPDEPLAELLVNVTDADAVGAHVLDRIQTSSLLPQGLPKPSGLETSAALLSQMSQLKEATGRRPRRFKAALKALTIQQNGDVLLFDQLSVSESDYIFHSTTDPEDQARLSAPYSAQDVGNLVIRILTGEAPAQG
jgi:hypothetical protein